MLPFYREGDERCVCDQMLQSGITPAAETSVCITKKDQSGDITVNDVCGKDKFGEDICFLNGCGDIISGGFRDWFRLGGALKQSHRLLAPESKN